MMRSSEISAQASDNTDNAADPWENPKMYRHVCTHCGATFKSLHKEDSFCSNDCENLAMICHADI